MDQKSFKAVKPAHEVDHPLLTGKRVMGKRDWLEIPRGCTRGCGGVQGRTAVVERAVPLILAFLSQDDPSLPDRAQQTFPHEISHVPRQRSLVHGDPPDTHSSVVPEVGGRDPHASVKPSV